MPTSITRTPLGVEHKDPGIGGRPPMHHRPTGGGGDGENWGDHPQRQHGLRDLLRHYRVLLFVALSIDLVFSIALMVFFYTQRHTGPIAKPMHISLMLWANSALLLLSGVTMEVARRQMFREPFVMDEWFGLGRPTVRHAAPWLAATVALGVLFLAGQRAAWLQLRVQGAAFHKELGVQLFSLVTAAHGALILVGILALVAVFPALLLAKRMEVRQIIVDCAAWYWYIIGSLWFFIFGALLSAQ